MHNNLDPKTAKTARSLASSVGFSAECHPDHPSNKLRSISILLCLLGFIPGIGGLHRFYVGRPWTGLLYIFTAGLFYIGTLLDLIVLLSGAFADGKGCPLVYWTKAERNEVLNAKEVS